MKGKNKYRDLGWFIVGVVAGLGFILLMNKLTSFISLPRDMGVVSTVLIIVTLAVYLVIARYLFTKRSPYLGLGFLLGPLAGVLMLLMMLIELSIHPPDDE